MFVIGAIARVLGCHSERYLVVVNRNSGLITRLRELIAALDRRSPRPERVSEEQIALDSAELRNKAVAQIAHLEGANEPCPH